MSKLWRAIKKAGPQLQAFYVIFFFWSVSMLMDFAVPAYIPPTGLHAVMMVAAGWLFTKDVVGKGKDDKTGD